MHKTPALPVEKDLELKAYIYQQLIEIQPYLVADSQVSVAIEEFKEKRKKSVVVTLTASVDEGDVEFDGQGTDFYQAFGAAKVKMVQQLNEIQNSLIDSAEREMLVRSAMSGGLTLH